MGPARASGMRVIHGMIAGMAGPRGGRPRTFAEVGA